MRLVRFLLQVLTQSAAAFAVGAVVGGIVGHLLVGELLFTVAAAIVCGGLAGAVVLEQHFPEDDPVDDDSPFRRFYRWVTGGPERPA